MTAFLEHYHAYTVWIEDALNKIMLQCNTKDASQTLISAMQYSLNAGGKRLRPILAMATDELFSSHINHDRIMPLAVSIELIHTYSLIHDDLPAMDNDDFRRGQPTNHKMFGEPMAILAGDALLNLAFEHMLAGADLHNQSLESLQNYIAAMKIIAKASGGEGMVGGQSEDIMNEMHAPQSHEKIQYIHEHKTEALISAAVLSAARCNNASAEQTAALEVYAQAIGHAFQIVDDILDVEGDSSVIGKSIGKDWRDHKLTYAGLYGVDVAKSHAEALTAQACAALNIFGDKAEFLRAIAQNLLVRNK